MEPAEAWDAILESSRRKASMITSARSSRLVRLPLRTEPERRFLRKMPREVHLIPDELRTKIRLLVSGKAPWPLVIVGAVGTGKTCAALSLLDYAGGEYLTVEDLCESLIASQQGRLNWRAEGRGGTIWPETFWANLGRAPLVVLDEMGARDRVSDFAYSAVERLVDMRGNDPMVCVSNLGLGRLAKVYDDRLASRLAAGTVVMLDGPDRRLEENDDERDG